MLVDNIKETKYDFDVHGQGDEKVDQRVKKLLEKKIAAQRESDLAAAELASIQAACRHNWGPVKYDPIIQKAYTIPGDPPGTMGVDWQPAVYVPRKETPRWTRTCLDCDLTEETKRVSKKTTDTPIF